MIMIDIDRLLELTSETTSESIIIPIKIIEIDKILESTREW